MSYETYKERKSGAGQILTGLGKWWGRKPLVYARALLLGILLPASDDIKRDTEIYMKLLGLSERELLKRKNKKLEPIVVYEYMTDEEKADCGAVIEYKTNGSVLHTFKKEVVKRIKDENYSLDTLPAEIAFKYATEEEKKQYFKVHLGLKCNQYELEIFKRLPYDLKLKYCEGLDKVDNLSRETWEDINNYLGTNAYSYQEIVKQLGERRFGHVPTVGDPFCGGGNIPFEAARLGFNVYASDLNPVAMLLTWSALNLLGLPEDKIKKLKAFQERIFKLADKQITEWGIEHNSQGHRANAYLYCTEAVCPDCGWRVPLAPSWIIGKNTRTVAILKENAESKSFDIEIKMNASDEEMEIAKKGTVMRSELKCPHCKNSVPISKIRGDKKDEKGNTIWGLRRWEKHEFVPREDDVFQERLYCIRYEKEYKDENGRIRTERYYKAPDEEDLEREKKVIELLGERFSEWQQKGYIPSDVIEEGYNTSQPIRERGWAYWHQLFNPRQLLLHGLLMELIDKEAKTREERIVGLLGVNRCCNWNSKLCIWDPTKSGGIGHTAQTFYNQALNTLFNYGVRGLKALDESWFFKLNRLFNIEHKVLYTNLLDARILQNYCMVWLTDPPYADAVNYHELSEFFLAWDKKFLKEVFPEWYTDSKRALAIKGSDDQFKLAMTEAFKNIAEHTLEGGYVIIMFTHQSAKVFASLVQILLSAGLRIMNAWSVATETESVGIDEGNYVQSTVAIILKKDSAYKRQKAFLRQLRGIVKNEVEKQIHYMMEVENGLKGNKIFTSADLELAGYYAALRVLTAYDISESEEKMTEFLEDMRSYASSIILPEGFKGLGYDIESIREVWASLNNYEKYYIRGLEFEKEGERKIKLYQDAARGLGILDYDDLLGENRVNRARVKTATEFGMTILETQHGFSNTMLRYILAAINVTQEKIREIGDETTAISIGHEWLKNKLGSEYWHKKLKVEILLRYISNLSILPQWVEDSRIARHLLERVVNDRM